jgi:uncharacterized membrane protein
MPPPSNAAAAAAATSTVVVEQSSTDDSHWANQKMRLKGALFTPSPPAVIALVLGVLDIGHQIRVFAKRPAGADRKQEMKETLKFSGEMLLDSLIVVIVVLSTNFLYNNRMRAFSWTLVIAPIAVIVATIALCAMQLREERRRTLSDKTVIIN